MSATSATAEVTPLESHPTTVRHFQDVVRQKSRNHFLGRGERTSQRRGPATTVSCKWTAATVEAPRTLLHTLPSTNYANAAKGPYKQDTANAVTPRKKTGTLHKKTVEVAACANIFGASTLTPQTARRSSPPLSCFWEVGDRQQRQRPRQQPAERASGRPRPRDRHAPSLRPKT